MSAFTWKKEYPMMSHGMARSVSDFEEIIKNFGLSPVEAYYMFKNELTPAMSYYFVARLDTRLAVEFIADKDDIICKILNERLEKERRQANGGIII